MEESEIATVCCTMGVMNSLVKKLATMSSEDNKVKRLKSEIMQIRDLMRKLAARHVPDAQVMEWMRQAREVAYDVEDWIDLSTIHHRGRGRPQADQQSAARGARIQEFMLRIDDVAKRFKRYNLLHRLPKVVRYTSSSSIAKVFVDKDRLVPEENFIRYCERITQMNLGDDLVVDLKYNLTKDNLQNELKVIFILGDRGMGKTMHATKIYRSMDGRGQYDCRAFVSVGRNSTVHMTLLNIAGQLNLTELQAASSLGEHKVTEIISDFLSNKRYFIVIDDIWAISSWNDIKCALPENNHGSRIITTTHIDKIARSCSRSAIDSIHRLGALNEEVSREFFTRMISDIYCWLVSKPELGELSDSMLSICGGAPLALVIAVAFTRTALPTSLNISDLKQYPLLRGTRKMLHISYDDLSLPLKSALLYLSLFPENSVITKDRLIRRWLAEGFIAKRDEDSMWETAEGYFNELISRRLIMMDWIEDNASENIFLKDGGGVVVACKIHGLVHEFIMSLSSPENMVISEAEIGSMQSDVFRRVTINNYNMGELSSWPSITAATSKIRSLAIIGNSRLISDIVGFKLLRVLDLEDCESLENGHVEKLGNLFLLRYLGLGGTGVTELPEDIGELHELQTLDVRRTSVKQLPLSANGLQKLVFLLGDGMQAPAGVEAMQDLEEVSFIDVSDRNSLHSVSELLLKSSKRLRILGVRWDPAGDGDADSENYRDTMKNFLRCIIESHKLKYISLCDYPISLLDIALEPWACWWASEAPEVRMVLRGNLNGVPNDMTRLSKLTHLHISFHEVKENDFEVLARLPILVLLKLSSVRSAQRSCNIKYGFRRLEVFSFICSDHWMALLCEGVMGRLRRVRIAFRAKGLALEKADFSILQFRPLMRVHVTVDCRGATSTEVTTIEAAITSQVDENPNKPTLELSRKWADQMLMETIFTVPPPIRPQDELTMEIDVQITSQNSPTCTSVSMLKREEELVEKIFTVSPPIRQEDESIQPVRLEDKEPSMASLRQEDHESLSSKNKRNVRDSVSTRTTRVRWPYLSKLWPFRSN